MASPEMIGLLCAGSVKYHLSHAAPSGDALSRSELAGFLAGLNGPQVDLAFARYGCDEVSERRLIAHTRVWLSGRAVRDEWKIIRGRPTVCNMAALAVIEVVRPNRCGRCKGRGVVENRVCHRCGGSSYVHLSGRQIAEAIGVDECNYRRTWSDRYELAYRYVQDIDFNVKLIIGRADRRGDLIAI